MLIRQAQILLPDDNLFLGDVKIERGKISQIAPDIVPTETDKVIDATGLTLLPGVIDPQVHFRRKRTRISPESFGNAWS